MNGKKNRKGKTGIITSHKVIARYLSRLKENVEKRDSYGTEQN
jgi:hypothetical protein